MDTAWIVLTLIFAILLLILLFNKKGKEKPNREINFNENIVINELKEDGNNTPSLRMSFTTNDVTLKEVINVFQSFGPKRLKNIDDFFKGYIISCKRHSETGRIIPILL